MKAKMFASMLMSLLLINSGIIGISGGISPYTGLLILLSRFPVKGLRLIMMVL